MGWSRQQASWEQIPDYNFIRGPGYSGRTDIYGINTTGFMAVSPSDVPSDMQFNFFYCLWAFAMEEKA